MEVHLWKEPNHFRLHGQESGIRACCRVYLLVSVVPKLSLMLEEPGNLIIR